MSEVTPLELVSAYGVFANGGVRAEPFAIRKVTDQQGRILEQHVTETQEVMRPQTAHVLVDVMKGVIERGTGARAKVLQRPLAGKTGTTDDATDLWFVGFSPSLVAGVWIGYDVKRSLGSAETGGRLALPIWIHFMQKALAGTEAEDFPAPEGAGPTNEDLQLGRSAPPENRAPSRSSPVRAPNSQGRRRSPRSPRWPIRPSIAPPLTPQPIRPRPAPAARRRHGPLRHRPTRSRPAATPPSGPATPRRPSSASQHPVGGD